MSNTQPEFVKIRVETLNGIINYLCTKPFAEVAEMIDQIRNNIGPLDIPAPPESDPAVEETKPE